MKSTFFRHFNVLIQDESFYGKLPTLQCVIVIKITVLHSLVSADREVNSSKSEHISFFLWYTHCQKLHSEFQMVFCNCYVRQISFLFRIEDAIDKAKKGN